MKRALEPRGQAAVELALIAPILVLLIMMLVQAALLSLAKFEVHMAARRVALSQAMFPDVLDDSAGEFIDAGLYGGLDPGDYFRWSTDHTGSGFRVYQDGKFNVLIRYLPLLTPEEKDRLSEIEVEGEPMKSGLVAMGALDFGYEEVTASVTVPPLPVLSWLHPAPFLVDATVIRGLSEGIEP